MYVQLLLESIKAIKICSMQEYNNWVNYKVLLLRWMYIVYLLYRFL